MRYCTVRNDVGTFPVRLLLSHRYRDKTGTTWLGYGRLNRSMDLLKMAGRRRFSLMSRGVPLLSSRTRNSFLLLQIIVVFHATLHGGHFHLAPGNNKIIRATRGSTVC